MDNVYGVRVKEGSARALCLVNDIVTYRLEEDSVVFYLKNTADLKIFENTLKKHGIEFVLITR